MPNNVKQSLNLVIAGANGIELSQEDKELIELLAAVMANRDKFRVVLEQNNPNTDNFKDQINELVEEHLKSAGIDDNTINSMKDKIQNMEPQEFDKYLTTIQLASILKDYAKTANLPTMPNMDLYVTTKIFDSLSNLVNGMRGQYKVFYDNEYTTNGNAIKNLTSALKAIRSQLLTIGTESDKNKDGLTQVLHDLNNFQKQYMTEEDTEAKFRIVNDLIDDIKKQIAAQATPVSPIVLSNERILYTVMAGTGDPDLNVTDNIITFGASGQQIELEETLSNKAADYEIVIDNDETHSFYIPEYINDQSPLRASLKTDKLSIQVHGEDAKFKIFCVGEPDKIGHFEIRKKWQAN